MFGVVLFQYRSFDICIEVPARGQDKRKMVVAIELPPEFPNMAPKLRCSYERHRFIDGATYYVNPAIHAGLENWKATSDLATILCEIHVNIFQEDPPIPFSPGWSSATNHPLALPLEHIKDVKILDRMIDASDPPSVQPSLRSNASNHHPVDAYAPSTDDIQIALSSKSVDELRAGFDPQAFLDSWELTASTFRRREDLRTQQRAELDALKSENSELKTELTRVENERERLLNETRKLGYNVESLRSIIQQLDANYTPQAICDQLLASAQKEELHSEDLASLFTKGLADPITGSNIDVDTFLTNYMDLRQLYRSRISKRAILLSTPRDVSARPSPLTTSSNTRSTATSAYSSYPSSMSSNRPM